MTRGCATPDAVWLARSYPVISVLAPVLTSHEGKIEYPGDPMCLYAALSWTIDQAVKSRQAGLGDGPYNDLCPRLGDLPSLEYRQAASTGGIRQVDGGALNTDQTVFDPRVWNDKIKRYFIWMLKTVRPRVVLISAVSPAHRYALDIARVVKQHDPTILVILGGRHADETMRYRDGEPRLDLAYSSALQAMSDGRLEPVIDFLVSGEGYHALNLLMKAISIAMDLKLKTVAVSDVVNMLDQLATVNDALSGQAVIAAIEGQQVHVFPMRGKPTDLANLPPPYRAFAIRAEFSIFESPDGRIQRTAHMMTTNACPFRCNFCSEAVTVVGHLLRFSCQPVQTALEYILEYVSYGAEAIFFDDSVFWAGNFERMFDFCASLSDVKSKAAADLDLVWPRGEENKQRLVNLQWGAQMTFEFLTTLMDESRAIELLRAMRSAGCTYVYCGLESMVPAIMDKVHKNIHKEIPWKSKVRKTLELFKQAGIRVGVSVLFGLEGETRDTIEETIEAVSGLVQEDLIHIASPNVCTYHPGTHFTRLHDMEDRIDYISLDVHTGPPYIYFEEAFRGVVSKELTEDDIWYIHLQTQQRWGQKRNVNQMRPTEIPRRRRTPQVELLDDF